MTGKADVQTHLQGRRRAIADTLTAWADLTVTAAGRRELVELFLQSTGLGKVQRVGTTSLFLKSTVGDSRRATILVVGRHSTADLSTRGASARGSELAAGPGTASQLASTMAFVEGVSAALTLTPNDAVNVNVVSLGDGDNFATVGPSLFTGNVDAVFMTDAVVWNTQPPTITTGARGQITAELRLSAGQPTQDFLTAGALRNPLTRLTQVLGRLRNSNGRIDLPGFYDRANAPDAGVRAALAANDHDPNAWADGLRAARPTGTSSSLERATLWPSINVLDIQTDTDSRTSAGAAAATVAIYLIPDQRHAEVERSLREWFTAAAPENLHPSVKLISSTRPYRCPADSLPVAAQARALYRLTGHQPISVPAGGPAGAGEIAFAVGAPVAFAGLAPLSGEFGTMSETLSWSWFDQAVEVAAETILQLRRA